MVLAPGLQPLPIAKNFPVTLFAKPIQPIMSLIYHFFGYDDANIYIKAALGLLRKMMQTTHLFYIPTFLIGP